MSESEMWKSLKKVMKSYDPVRIESPVSPGVPDVNYTHGWIELKYLEKWPIRENTLVKIHHFTKQQKAWLIRRCLARGLVFLMLKVGESEWLLFNGRTAAENIGKCNKEQLVKLCLARWYRLPKIEELRLWII